MSLQKDIFGDLLDEKIYKLLEEKKIKLRKDKIVIWVRIWLRFFLDGSNGGMINPFSRSIHIANYENLVKNKDRVKINDLVYHEYIHIEQVDKQLEKKNYEDKKIRCAILYILKYFFNVLKSFSYNDSKYEKEAYKNQRNWTTLK